MARASDMRRMCVVLESFIKHIYHKQNVSSAPLADK